MWTCKCGFVNTSSNMDGWAPCIACSTRSDARRAREQGEQEARTNKELRALVEVLTHRVAALEARLGVEPPSEPLRCYERY